MKTNKRPVNLENQFTGRLWVYSKELLGRNHALWRACHAFIDVVDEHVEQARHRFLAAPSHVWRDD